MLVRHWWQLPVSAVGSTDHRPWPIPGRPWAWRQTWHDLLFLHWPVAPQLLRPLVPPQLEIEQHSGSAWVGVVPFWMSGIARRPLPPLPGLSRFPEMNVRTYVRFGDRPGVWFFSLDATNRLAVWAARRWFHLPYHYARMEARRIGDEVRYRSTRPTGAGFEATYAPTGPAAPSAAGTLEAWLTERYCLYARAPSGVLFRADIHHAPWALQPARATVGCNDMLSVNGIAVGGPAEHLRYAAKMSVVVWSAERITRAAGAAAVPR